MKTMEQKLVSELVRYNAQITKANARFTISGDVHQFAQDIHDIFRAAEQSRDVEEMEMAMERRRKQNV